MKSKLVVILVTLFALNAHAAEFEVEWQKPKEFRDIRPNDNMSRSKFRKRVMERLGKHFDKQAKRLPEGLKLHMTVTDVDLAGEVRPWHGGNWIRVIKSPYAPMLKFTYSLTDKKGEILLKGEERLRDVTFDMRLSMNKVNPEFHHERYMFDKWFNKTFASYLPQKTNS